MTYIEAIIRVQNALKVPKTRGGQLIRYKYRNCEDILNAVKPLLHKEKLLLSLKDKVVMVGDRFYIEATASIRDFEGNVILESSGFAREDNVSNFMSSAQLTGASSSYARKYALNGLFLIDDSTDADEAANIAATKTKLRQKSKLTDDRFSAMIDSIKKGEFTIQKAFETFDLSEDQKKKLKQL